MTGSADERRVRTEDDNLAAVRRAYDASGAGDIEGWAEVWRFRDGQVVEMRPPYWDTTRARECFGAQGRARTDGGSMTGNGSSDNGTTNGFGKYLGLSLEEVSGDVVRGTVAVSPDHHQGHGIVHGGVWCAVVEHVASVAAGQWFAGRGQVVGVSNSTNFVRAARTGLVQVEATPLQRGRTQQLWQVFITDDRQRLIAKGEVRLANIADPGVLGD